MTGERWLVRLMVTRDPDTETTPHAWDWEQMLGGGDPVVLHTELVGIEADYQPTVVEDAEQVA